MHDLNSRHPMCGLVLLLTGTVVCAAGPSATPTPTQTPTQQQPTATFEAPVQLTAEQDHQRLLDLLHIKELRRGPDGDPTSPRAANFDESKVKPYKLPDPLVLKSGQPVRTAQAWWQKRRPELLELFDKEVYGRVPSDAPKVIWQVTRTQRESVEGVPVITKDIVGHLDNGAYPLINVDIQLTLTTPLNAPGPVPVMMEFGLTPQVQAAVRKRFTDAQWAAYQGPGPSWQSQVLAKGWGYAILIPSSVQADNGAGLTQGVIGLANKGQPRKLDDWGVLRAWAWGASRALDYLETDRSVDAKQAGIEGLSRYGKAALVTMAYEPRFAIGFIGSSGEGGAKLSRRTFGEQVENIASSSEYHWMAGNFLRYAGPLTRDDLPVDAHELLALCAPRPVFVSSGSQAVEGGWVDAKGMFLGAAGAGPVYRLLGKKDLGANEFPSMETALIDGDIAFRQHRYGHTTGPNWSTFLTFASRYLKSPSPVLQAANLGIFESQADIGSVTPPGTGSYSPATDAYTLTSAGANTWYHVDNFHYVWKQVTGDMALSADVVFPPRSYAHEPDPHRKGILMFRQTLDAGGIYAGVSVHGSGMTALQYRRERGANGEDIELNIPAPKTVRLEKHGDTFTLYLSMNGEPIHQVGASITLHLEEPFYVGLGAVSHDVSTTDKVEFSHVTLQPPESTVADAKLILYSTVQTISIEDQFRRAMVIRTVPAYLQSANWAPDRKSIYVYENAHVMAIPYLDPPAGGAPRVIDTGGLLGCGGNYGLSPDGKWLAITCAGTTKGGTRDVYLLPAAAGGASRKITSGKLSSYFHAWSPDSQTIAFTRGSAGKADIFTIAIQGGAERRLTSDTINDGPDYSVDGKLIYFDSSRTGMTQIWRMNADGSAAEQVTDDRNINSSPHVSPDGKTLAFLSEPLLQGPGLGAASIKVMSTNDGLIRSVASFHGNRSSFSTYGWGDDHHLAFISYQLLPASITGRSGQ
jgi:(4-O-methyl)-D-glucuronate---lignin esterase